MLARWTIVIALGALAVPQGGRPELRLPEEDIAQKYFAIADYNSDKWISFKEAQASLGIDRDSFAVYDTDRDGRIDAAEFRKRYESIIERGGAFPPPAPKAQVKRAPRRTSEELIKVYDKNNDEALDARELKRALEDYLVLDLTPEIALEKLDHDRSTKLELPELPELVEVLSPKPAVAAAPRYKNVDELFGKAQPRVPRPGSTPLPPRVPGPVSAFRRLDVDDDKQIEIDDLIELQRPLQLQVRINAVLAALDADHDGVLTPEEFWNSMAPGAR